MLVRVRDFGLAHAGLFAASTVGAQMFATVAATVTALSDHAKTQVQGQGAADEGVATKAAGRRALRSQLEQISHTARALAVDTPGLEKKFRLPSNLNDQTLLATARAFADDASAVATAFVAHELPANFLVQLNDQIEKFEAAIHDRSSGRSAHIAARAGIRATLRSGLVAVTKLDAIMPNKLDGDPVALAAWESARHIEQPPHSKHETKAATAATAASTPATEPATLLATQPAAPGETAK